MGGGGAHDVAARALALNRLRSILKQTKRKDEEIGAAPPTAEEKSRGKQTKCEKNVFLTRDLCPANPDIGSVRSKGGIEVRLYSIGGLNSSQNFL